MRPKYETDKDVANEKDVADKIAAARGYMMVKLPPMSKMDYAAFSTEGIKAFIEIKRRNVVKAKYDAMMIGMEKVMWARQAKRDVWHQLFLVRPVGRCPWLYIAECRLRDRYRWPV